MAGASAHQPARHRANNRIKMSRELVVRLSQTLGQLRELPASPRLFVASELVDNKSQQPVQEFSTRGNSTEAAQLVQTSEDRSKESEAATGTATTMTTTGCSSARQCLATQEATLSWLSSSFSLSPSSSFSSSSSSSLSSSEFVVAPAAKRSTSFGREVKTATCNTHTRYNDCDLNAESARGCIKQPSSLQSIDNCHWRRPSQKETFTELKAETSPESERGRFDLGVLDERSQRRERQAETLPPESNKTTANANANAASKVWIPTSCTEQIKANAQQIGSRSDRKRAIGQVNDATIDKLSSIQEKKTTTRTSTKKKQCKWNDSRDTNHQKELASSGPEEKQKQPEPSEAPNCDSCAFNCCPARRKSSSCEWQSGRRRTSWLVGLSSSIAWLLLAWFLMPSSPEVRLSSAQFSSAPSTTKPALPLDSGVDEVIESTSGDELHRAVLATMSTQAPIELATSPLVNVSSRPTLEPTQSLANVPSNSIQQATQTTSSFESELVERILSFLRIFIMFFIIIGDICGNSLVILSVCRHSKLRVTTNWFVVSLACADILVALFAMTFNASVIISGRWLFASWVCDFWNSCDVLASTASNLHLCCISIDRYVAIMRPLDYPMKITTRRVMYTLCAVWISSALLSYLPIFTGVYTTSDHIKWLEEHPDQCEFHVNRVYAIVSSSISFWIPCCIMIIVYYRIFREATRQEKFIYKAQSMMPAPMVNHGHHGHHSNHLNSSKAKQRRSKSVAVAHSSNSGGSNEARIKNLARQQQEMQAKKPPVVRLAPSDADIATTKLTGSTASIPVEAGGGSKSEQASAEQVNLLSEQSKPLARVQVATAPALPEEDDEDSNSGQSTPTNRSISKMKREHKAAKTLGIIMGVFILCWLPFFSWYTPTQICGKACEEMVPKQAVTILFWIGYFNSMLNPIIYAYFNHEFRDAFKKTLQWIFCCCNDLKCLRVNRPNDNQHYNCTYRSTQEIGLVNS